MVRVRIKCDAPSFTPDDYTYIMQCRDIKPRYKILKELLDKYKTSSKRIYQIWRGEEANRVLWDQPIPHLYDGDDSNIMESISSAKTNWENKVSINDAIHSEVLPDKLAEMAKPKIQNSTSLHSVKKSDSSIDNTSRIKSDLEKLMKDTERLAPICPSLPQ
ncbi:4769_t:CDS:1 [Paraglomus occultum]|uniref:4769_t:CDS:1 n=1 Tax=Paraglomus occultum TaxID=144539 RepID=A0A9N9H710_9GLOM|nr:4769_t:CDS:1 [Paraglomus occultum]